MFGYLTSCLLSLLKDLFLPNSTLKMEESNEHDLLIINSVISSSCGFNPA